MTLALMLIFVALVALAATVGLAILRRLRVVPGSGLAAELEPLDVDAFRNLADPEEEAYLRSRLTCAEFRSVRRMRLRALAAYLQAAGRNAAVLILVGERAMASADPETVKAAKQLVNQALVLRHSSFFVLLRVYLAFMWPAAGSAVIPVLDTYGQMRGAAMLLGRLQNPAVPVRL